MSVDNSMFCEGKITHVDLSRLASLDPDKSILRQFTT